MPFGMASLQMCMPCTAKEKKNTTSSWKPSSNEIQVSVTDAMCIVYDTHFFIGQGIMCAVGQAQGLTLMHKKK